MTFAEFAAKSPEKDPKKLIEDYRGEVQVDLLRNGEYDPQLMGDVDNQLLQHAKDQGIEMAGFGGPAQEDDTQFVARQAIHTGEQDVVEAADRLRALRDPGIKASYADRPDEYATKLEDAQVGYEAVAPLEKREAARRAALNRGDIPFAAFTDKDGNRRVELGSEVLGIAGDDKALAELFAANPSLDRNLIPEVRRKLQTPAGFTAPLAKIERQKDFTAAFEAVAPSLKYQLDGLERAVSLGVEPSLTSDTKANYLEQADAALAGTPLAEQFSPEERKQFIRDYAIRNAPIKLDPDAPEKGLRTLSTGEVHIPVPLMMNKATFDKVLPSLPEGQREMAADHREQVVAAYAKDAFKTIAARRPEFTDEYAAAKAEGKSDTEILDAWTANPKNQSTAYEYVSGIAESIPGALVTAAAALPALGGNRAAAGMIRYYDTQTQQRKEFANIVGKDLGMGYDIGTMIAPVVVDIFATHGAAALARGTVGAAARAAIKPVVRGFFGATVREETKGLVNSFVKGAVNRELKREGLAALPGAAASLRPTEVLGAIGRDIEAGLSRAEYSSAMFASGFNRAAGQSYVQIYSTLEGLKNPDGSRKFDDAQVRDMAVKHATIVGTMTGLTTLGFNALGLEGTERIFSGGLTRKQTAGVFSRLQKDWKNMAPAVREGLDMTSADTMVASMMAKSLTPMWKVGVRGAAEEFPEEATQQFLEDITIANTTGEKFDVVKSLKGALYAGMLGGIMGAGATVSADVVSSPKADARREAATRRNALLETAAKLDANPNTQKTAAALREFALNGIPEAPAQEDVPEGVPAAGAESAPSEPAVAGQEVVANDGTVWRRGPDGKLYATQEVTPDTETFKTNDGTIWHRTPDGKVFPAKVTPSGPAVADPSTITTNGTNTETEGNRDAGPPRDASGLAQGDGGATGGDSTLGSGKSGGDASAPSVSPEQVAAYRDARRQEIVAEWGSRHTRSGLKPGTPAEVRDELETITQDENTSQQEQSSEADPAPVGGSGVPNVEQAPEGAGLPEGTPAESPNGGSQGIQEAALKKVTDQGYALTYEVKDGKHIVTARDAEGNKVGQARFVEKNGGLKYEPGSILHVEAKDRRKGVATALYVKAERESGKIIQGSPIQTGEGAAFTNQPNRPFGATAETTPATPASAPQGTKSQLPVSPQNGAVQPAQPQAAAAGSAPKVGDPITFTSSVPGTQTPTQGVIAAIDAKGKITAQVGKTRYPNAKIVAEPTQITITNPAAVFAAADAPPATPAVRKVTDAFVDTKLGAVEAALAETPGGKKAATEVLEAAMPELVRVGEIPLGTQIELLQGGASENVRTLVAAEGENPLTFTTGKSDSSRNERTTRTTGVSSPDQRGVGLPRAEGAEIDAGRNEPRLFAGEGADTAKDSGSDAEATPPQKGNSHERAIKVPLEVGDPTAQSIAATRDQLKQMGKESKPDTRFTAKNSPVTADLAAHGGVEDIKAWLTSVAKTGRPEHRELAKVLLRFPDVLVTPVHLQDAPFAGTFVPQTGQVLINTARPGPRGGVDTVLHELVHAATHASIKNPTPEQAQVLKRIDAIRRNIQKRAAKAGRADLAYGLGSLDEFFSHVFTSPAFQREVAAMTPKGERNWVHVLIDAVRDLLGLKSSVLKDMIEFTQSAADLKYGRHAMTTDGRVLMLPAHHGTPHKVDKFSTDKIGTGEGAQVYGWGLYFAGDQRVAKWYKDTLGKPSVKLVVESDLSPNAARELKEIREKLAFGDTDGDLPSPTMIIRMLRNRQDMAVDMKRLGGNVESSNATIDGVNELVEAMKSGMEVFSTGNLYTVEILADEEEMLDWDKPLSEQSDSVKQAVKAGIAKLNEAQLGEALGRAVEGNETDYDRDWNPTDGAMLYKKLALLKTPAEASKFLNGLGIPGIKFLDGNSRKTVPSDLQIKAAEKSVASWKASVEAGVQGAKDQLRYAESHLAEVMKAQNPSYNYVIFDASQIQITHENGVPVTPEQATAPAPGPYGTSRMDALMQMPEDVRDEVRFAELTENLGESPTQADIDSFKEANPERYAELKAMRERVLWGAGFTTGPVYHGTRNAGFVTFTTNQEGRYFFADSKEYAEKYAAGEYFGTRLDGRSGVMELLLKLENPIDLDAYMAGKLPDTTGDTVDEWIAAGFDGARSSEGGGTVQVFSPYQIKLAEPLSLDPATGRLIGPDQWGDTESPSILFQPSEDAPEAEAPVSPEERLTASHDAGVAALDNVSDTEHASLHDYHDLTTTGNVSDRQRAHYRVQPNALERLVTYLKAVVKHLADSLKRAFNMTTAVHLDRLGRELAAAEDGYRIRSGVKPFDPNDGPLMQMSEEAPSSVAYLRAHDGSHVLKFHEGEYNPAMSQEGIGAWLKNVFGTGSDLPESMDQARKSDEHMRAATETHFQNLMAGYAKAAKGMSEEQMVQIDGLLNYAVGDTAPMLTPTKEQELNDGLDAKLKAALELTTPEATAKAIDEANEWAHDTKIKFEIEEAEARIARRDKAQEELNRIHPELGAWAQRMRTVLTDTQKELLRRYGKDHPMYAKIDRSLGIYLVRSYAIHRDPRLADKILHDPSYQETRDSAVDFFEKQLANDMVEKLKGKTPGWDAMSEAEVNAAVEAQRVEDQVKRMKRSGDYASVDDATLLATAKLNVANQAQLLFEDLILGNAKTGNRSGVSGDSLKTNVSRFLEKKNIPEELRNALAEIRDPVWNATHTFAELSNLVHSHRMLGVLTESGIASGILVSQEKVKANPKKYFGWKPVAAADSRSRAYAPLAGYYANPENVEAFQAVFRTGSKEALDTAEKSANAAMKFMMGMAGFSLGVTTLGNIGFYLRNPIGGVFNLLSQGHNPLAAGALTAARGVARAAFDVQNNPDVEKGVIRNALLGKDDADTEARILELTALGIIGNGSQIGYTREILKMAIENPSGAMDAAQGVIGKGSVKLAELFAQGREKGKDFVHLLGSFAQVSEEVPMVIAYNANVDMLTRAQFGSPQAIKQEAARRAKLTVFAKSESSQGLKAFSHNPVAAVVVPFARFKGEVFRVLVNTYKLAREDMRSENPVIKAEGRKRMASALAVHGVLTVATPLLLAALSGIGGDEDRALRAAMPDYDKNTSFWFFRGADGVRSVSLTYLNPYSFSLDPVTGTLRSLMGGNEDQIPGILARVFTDEIFGENIVAGKVIDLKRNVDESTGLPLWLDTDDAATRASKMILHVASAYNPGVVKGTWRAFEASRRPEQSDQPWYYTPGGIMLGQLAPTKIRVHNLEDMAYRAFRDQARAQGQHWQITAPMRSPQGFPVDEVEDTYNTLRRADSKVQHDTYRISKGYESLGLDKRTLRQRMTDAGFSKEKSASILQGYGVKRNLSPDAIAKMNKTDPRLWQKWKELDRHQADRMDLRD